MTWELLVTIIGLLFTILAGCWTVYWRIDLNMQEGLRNMKKELESMDAKNLRLFETVFKRYDESREEYFNQAEKSKKEYYEQFVSKEVHKLQLEFQEQRTKDSLISVNKIFETLFNNLEQKVDELITVVKNKNHN